MKNAVIFVFSCILVVSLSNAQFPGGLPGFGPDYNRLLDLAAERLKQELPESYHERVDQVRVEGEVALADCDGQALPVWQQRRCLSLAYVTAVQKFNALRKEYYTGAGAANNPTA